MDLALQDARRDKLEPDRARHYNKQKQGKKKKKTPEEMEPFNEAAFEPVMIDFARTLMYVRREDSGRDYWAKQIFNVIEGEQPDNAVVLDIESLEELAFFKSCEAQFALLYVTANFHTRYERGIALRGDGPHEDRFYENTLASMDRENNGSVFRNKKHTITNTGSIEELELKVEKILKRYNIKVFS